MNDDSEIVPVLGEPAAKVERPNPVFSGELRTLLQRLENRPVSMGELLEATQGRGFYLLLLLIAIPFVGPVPLPGFSIPFGLVVTVLGSSLALGHKPWLPRAVLRRELPPQFFGRLLRGTTRLMEALEVFLKPRLGFVEAHAVFSRMAGFFITVSGLFMMLPFPLPFSNSLPAWTVLFLAAGALGHDGLFFVIGCGSFVLSVAFFTFVAVGGAAAIEQLQKLLLPG